MSIAKYQRRIHKLNAFSTGTFFFYKTWRENPDKKCFVNRHKVQDFLQKNSPQSSKLFTNFWRQIFIKCDYKNNEFTWKTFASHQLIVLVVVVSKCDLIRIFALHLLLFEEIIWFAVYETTCLFAIRVRIFFASKLLFRKQARGKIDKCVWEQVERVDRRNAGMESELGMWMLLVI